MAQQNYVTLNVGGSTYTTSVSTLTRVQSMLSGMFSGDFQNKKDDRGHIIIDRDGKLFRFILNYLRDGVLILPDDFKEHALLVQEAKFYQIEGLCKEVQMQEDKKKDTILSTYVTLNVRGHKYVVSHSTCREVLPKSSQTSIYQTVLNDGSIFINRDGELFQYILEYITYKTVSLPEHFTNFPQLITEAEYFELENLARELRKIDVEENEEEVCLVDVLFPGKNKRTINTTELSRKCPSSRLAKMMQLARDESRIVHLERSYELFDIIINFLYPQKSFLPNILNHVPQNFCEWNELMAEAQYYQMPRLVNNILRIRKSGIPAIRLYVKHTSTDDSRGSECILLNENVREKFPLFIQEAGRNGNDLSIVFTVKRGQLDTIVNFMNGCGLILPDEATTEHLSKIAAEADRLHLGEVSRAIFESFSSKFN